MMIDAHLHLAQYPRTKLKDEIERWRENGIKAVIAVADDLASSYETLELQQAFPHFVYACVGFHPERPIPSKRDVEEWKALIKHERERITAIGEIGLPHYELERLSLSLEEATARFYEYIDVAKSYDLPVALHAVHDKATIALQALLEKGVKHAHFHWLKADERSVELIVQAGYYISVTPEICYRRRDEQLAKRVPLSRLLIETDGPWRFDGEFKNEETTPLFLKHVIEKIAEIKNLSTEDVRRQVYENTRRCYHI